jgi:adenosine kinase
MVSTTHKPRTGKDKGMLVGMGNPLLDMSANVEPSMLLKYGLQPDNAILAEASHLPLYKELETDSSLQVDYVAGGATLNTMRVGQWCLQEPGVFSYFGSIGADAQADKLIKNAEEAGVNMKPQVNTTNPTGTCAVLITDNGKHRSLVANLSGANDFTTKHLDDESIWKIVEEADYFYIGGFFLTVSPDSILKVAAHAYENNKYVMMNLSAPFIPQFFAEPLSKCLPYVDVLFGNETEAVAFSKQQNFGTEDIKEIALKTAAIEKKNTDRQRMVVFTQGSSPTIVVREGLVSEYPVNAIKAEDIVDTNGAGDSFVGGFLSQFVQGCDLTRCIEVGNYAANYIIRQSGVTLVDKPNF